MVIRYYIRYDKYNVDAKLDDNISVIIVEDYLIIVGQCYLNLGQFWDCCFETNFFREWNPTKAPW